MYLLKNLTVYDGTGGKPFPSDILVADEGIAIIKDKLSVPDAEVIDCKGMAAAPGFIDVHSHSEYSLLAEPSAPSKLMQGITTDISGNCGMSPAPMLGAAAQHRKHELAELGLELSWTDFEGYFERLEEVGPAINFASFCGHGNIRASVMGYADRGPTHEEMLAMERLLQDAMEAGAFGLSTGLIYPPGVYAKTGEIVRLASRAARYGGIYTSHMRSEGAGVVEAIEETIRVGYEAVIPVQISHLKTGGPANWHKVDAVVAAIESARKDGVDVTADRYPYTASGTDLDAILPSWAYEGGHAEEMKRLRDPDTRARLRAEILAQHPDAEYWERVMVSSVVTDKNRHIEGKLISDVARQRVQEPVDALFEVLIEEEVRAQAIYFSMSDDNLRTFLKQPWLMIGSDSTARSHEGVTRQGKPHPRGFGSFPRVLKKFVREDGVLTMQEAIRKMSGMAADRLGLHGRGYIKRGKYADIVVFDPETVGDEATFEDPYRYPSGIRHVFVNGVPAVRDGALTGKRSGMVIRH